MKNSKKIVTIVLNVLFCAVLLWFFSRNCFLRPYAGSMWKELFTGVMQLATLYINYFLLYPLLVEKRHSRTLYWLVVGVMVLVFTVLELAIARPYVMECNRFIIEQVSFFILFSQNHYLLLVDATFSSTSSPTCSGSGSSCKRLWITR